jgi:adenylate cyclase
MNGSERYSPEDIDTRPWGGVHGRVAVMATLLLLPLAGFAMLLARPGLDLQWEHHPSHFLLVLGVALCNVLLGLLTSEAARRRGDARVFLVSLALLSSAGFLALHAMATPGVLLEKGNTGFVIATPIGLLLASFFAAASTLQLDGSRVSVVQRHQGALRAGLAAFLCAWAAASLTRLPLLDRPFPEEAPGILRSIALVGVAFYGFAAFRYARIYRRRRRSLPLAIAVAFVLLAEAMVAVAFSRSWHASWWEWHVLMAIAFGAITVAVRNEYRRQHSLTAAFGGLYLEGTLERIDRRHSDALAELAGAVDGNEPISPILTRLRDEGFSAEELTVLERSARELSRVNELFRPYVAPTLAEKLRREPELARLGGTEYEVTVLFADLAGFTTVSEGRGPAEVIEMLNTYWAAAVPLLAEREGGLIERFAGDAVMVVFNALGDQPDHALRASRAALGLRAETEGIWAGHADWPRFRIGVNTGPAVVGNVGAGGQRSFAVIGDTTNVAARLQAAAEPGRIVIGSVTYERIREVATAAALGPIQLKGKTEPVVVYDLIDLRG